MATVLGRGEGTRQGSQMEGNHPNGTGNNWSGSQRRTSPAGEVAPQNPTYPLQQQPSGSWTPSITAQPFYPSFYQPQQQQYSPAPSPQAQQWAYQQMMFNAQMQQQQIPRPPDYFGQNQGPPYNPFPSGTPVPYPNQQLPQQQQAPYGGFHPYRRPSRQPSAQSNPSDAEQRRGPPPPQAPYARTDASGSSSSVNSTGRPRTNSNQSSASAKNTNNNNNSSRNRVPSPQVQMAPPAPAPLPAPSRPHGPSGSSSSSGSTRTSPQPSPAPPTVSATTASAPAATPSSTSSKGSAVARPVRPSPLSQSTAAEKRMSRDDSDLVDAMPSASMMRTGGLKGRLRRALSFNAAQSLREEEEQPAAPERPAAPPARAPTPATAIVQSSSEADDSTDAQSTATVQTKKKSRAASLFSSRLNTSTDNLSLSSTVSSASVMIRKLGSMGKLARRNSLAGITSLFKDKKDKEDASGATPTKKGKKAGKAEASEPSVSHVTAELEPSSSGGDWTAGGSELNGLSPAAKLARQHTLKSNAEAAARAKEANAAAKSDTPVTWEKNTTTRQAESPMKATTTRINEDGTRGVLVEEDDSGSEDGTVDGQQRHGGHADGWDEDEDWENGDTTIRIAAGPEYDEPEPWAVDVRRSVERTRRPSKGILKYAGTYDQQTYANDLANANTSRGRSNSYNSRPGQNELGPLARIPSPDPDHIDGLHRHGSHTSSPHTASPQLPALEFGTESAFTDSPQASKVALVEPQPSAVYNHPNLNSSAPALSAMLGSGAPLVTHRSATAPSKHLSFANNLSVYDTFAPSVYDRRSEPATWSRLTPQLAQRIKEELNSYKMEEMEVHAASRAHTQFFV